MSNVYKRKRTQSPLEVISKSKELLRDVYALIMNEKKIEDKRIINLIHEMLEPFDEKGLGLGSQVSQILAVSYLNEFDHIISCEYGKPYVRYMDDFVIFCSDKADAQKMLRVVKDEARKAKLILNENKTYILKSSHRFTFLKTDFKISKTGKIIRMLTRSNVSKERIKLKKLAKMREAGLITCEDMKISYNSWKGYAQKKNAFRTIQCMDKLFDDLIKKGVAHD